MAVILFPRRFWKIRFGPPRSTVKAETDAAPAAAWPTVNAAPVAVRVTTLAAPKIPSQRRNLALFRMHVSLVGSMARGQGPGSTALTTRTGRQQERAKEIGGPGPPPNSNWYNPIGGTSVTRSGARWGKIANSRKRGLGTPPGSSRGQTPAAGKVSRDPSFAHVGSTKPGRQQADLRDPTALVESAARATGFFGGGDPRSRRRCGPGLDELLQRPVPEAGSPRQAESAQV